MTDAPAHANALRDALYEQLPDGVRAALDRVVSATAPHAAYAVGGVVRDLLLRRPLVDLDVALEADAIDVARVALPGAGVTAHTRFRTASLRIGATRIDLATARREAYSRPGALPKVSPADIHTDLERRDFSVNAMALRLDGAAALLDPFGGEADLRARRIRVLHDASFRDDATRIVRAFRYGARLGFDLETRTAELISRGLRFVSSIGGERLRRELELTFDDVAGGAALEQADERGALHAVHAALSWSERRTSALEDAPSASAARGQLGFALLAASATVDDAEAIITRLRLKRAQSAVVRAVAALQPHVTTLRRPQAKPSGVAVLLDRYPAAAVAAFAATAADPIAGQVARRYLDEWRRERPILDGDDLRAMGIPAGPQIERGLQLIRAARLDGWAHDRGDEEALILRFAKSIADSGAMAAPVKLHANGH